MNFLDLAKQRYTTKRYDANYKLSDETIQQLKEILRLTPSSINSQPWQFTFISDEETKTQLASTSFFNEQRINEASHLVVFSAIRKVEKFEEQIHTHLPEGAINYYQQFLKPLPEAELHAWFRHQVYLSLGFFLSACASMGIDSTPMEGIDSDAFDEILNAKDYATVFAVAIGRRHPEDSNQPHIKPKSRLPLDQVVKEI